MFTQEVTVNNEVGLHARPATYLSRGQRVQSGIWVEKEERRVNAKSLLGVLSLGIVKGTTITLIAEAPMRKRLSRRWWNWSRTTSANNTFDTGSTTRPCGAQGRVSLCEEAAGVTKEELREKANDLHWCRASI